jgi:hypothetical protein
VGIFGVAVPKMIEETVPTYLLDMFGTFTNTAMNFGGMLVIVEAASLPNPSDI